MLPRNPLSVALVSGVLLALLAACGPTQPMLAPPAAPGTETATVPVDLTPETYTPIVRRDPPLETPTPTSTPSPIATPADSPTPAPSPTATPVVLVGAGDIGYCGGTADEVTGALLDDIPGTVFTLGDNAYSDGTADQFVRCYDPGWGRHKGRTRPAPGNHDYHTDAAAPYFAYFGPAAGELGKGYYSYDLGDWHIVVLNSNCKAIGGCDQGSNQFRWLQQDLEASGARCTLAYAHHPRWSSGLHGSIDSMQPLWALLAESGVELYLAGHDHHYERFAPMNAAGQPDPERGLRQFVAGTGGRSHYAIEPQDRLPTSEVADDQTYGVLKLTLFADHYEWEFIPEPGGSFTDRGSAPCH